MIRQIRIIGTPPGEAPEEIREAWIGLTLPLADWPFHKRKNWSVAGVLSGPRSVFDIWWSFLFGSIDKMDGYAVYSAEAITELERRNPIAAEWWRENAPHCLDPKWKFVFPAEVCEVDDSQD